MKLIVPRCWLRVPPALTQLLCALAALAHAVAVETSPLRTEFAAMLHPLAKNTGIAMHIGVRAAAAERPLEFRYDPSLALIVESVCLLDAAFSTAGRPASDDSGSSDGGWNEGADSTGHCVENGGEVISQLHEITATMPMTRHEFLSADHKVRRAVFGKGSAAVVAVINTGEAEFRHRSSHGADVVLPPFGFVVEGPNFAMFYASRWAGVDYSCPSLFTLRSLDGRSLANSQRIRVFRAFGDARLSFAGTTQIIPREAVFTPKHKSR